MVWSNRDNRQTLNGFKSWVSNPPLLSEDYTGNTRQWLPCLAEINVLFIFRYNCAEKGEKEKRKRDAGDETNLAAAVISWHTALFNSAPLCFTLFTQTLCKQQHTNLRGSTAENRVKSSMADKQTLWDKTALRCGVSHSDMTA